MPMETRWGKLLGRYEIVAELGRGAMGIVYKACDPKIDRFVAIKTISLHQGNPEEQREFRDRFFTEAQAAGRLLHPGIVTVFDVGEEPETSAPFIVMEYIEGQTLRDLVDGGTKTLPLDRALQITQEIAEALDYAHAQGVVHRDIKPANILITKDGQAKVSDFGIAQLDFAHITVPGQVVGTPAYMSPEQLDGGQVDGRSDLFSLGAILYLLVTGFSPFQGNSEATVCYGVANRDPLQATALVPELPGELDAVITRALAKDPGQRYQRGMEFALDLRDLRERAQRTSHPAEGSVWFSQAEGRSMRFDGPAKSSASLTSSALADLSRSSTRTTHSSRSEGFRARTLLGATAILLLTGIALTFFAPRRNRVSAPPAGTNVVANAKRESIAPPPETPVSSVAPPSRPLRPHRIQIIPVVPETRQRMSETTPAVSQPPSAQPAIADSNLEIQIENHFPDATFSLWIDDKLVYEHPLREEHKSHLGLFSRGGPRGTLTLPLSAGQHEVRIHVHSEVAQYDESKSISGSFSTGGDKILAINFEKHTKEMLLTLR